MADEQLGLFDAIYSQRAIRSLKPDPVPDDVLHKIIEAGTKAPSGGNSQPWAFIIVQDHDSIAKIAEWAKAGFAVMYERALGRMKPGDELPFPRLKPLVESMEQVPVLLFPCHVRPEGAAPSPGGMSIYPAVQNMLLAARGLGIGAVLTNLGLGDADKIKELLGVPENVDLMATIPMGYPDKEHYGSTTRRPVSEVAHWGSWGALRS
jgi:nitroreductase